MATKYVIIASNNYLKTKKKINAQYVEMKTGFKNKYEKILIFFALLF